MVSLSLAPWPSANDRLKVSPEQWTASLNSWAIIVKWYLTLSSDLLEVEVDSPNRPLVLFVRSFVQETAAENQPRVHSDQETELRRLLLQLIHRLFGDVKAQLVPQVELAFLADICTVYPRSSIIQAVVERVWSAASPYLEATKVATKTLLIELLDSRHASSSLELPTALRRTIALLRTSRHFGSFLMAGSDIVDALNAAWARYEHLRKKFAIISYYGFLNLSQGPEKSDSLILDHLFVLQESSKQNQLAKPQRASLLIDLLQNTPLLRLIRLHFKSSHSGRAESLLRSLTATSKDAVTRRDPRPRSAKKNGLALTESSSRTEVQELEESRLMSQVTPIQDLFPQLGTEYILQLLGSFKGNLEEVIAYCLENSLTTDLEPHGQPLDKGGPSKPAFDIGSSLSHQSQRQQPDRRRRNIFDDDALSELKVKSSAIHVGRKEHTLVPQSNVDKAAIISALETFDTDSDERDDTYDADDVGGTVDTTPAGEDDVDRNEEHLFSVWTVSPAVFERSALARRGNDRANLRRKTNMTDEMIEGWGVMLARDPKKLRRLQNRYSAFSGAQQPVLPSISGPSNGTPDSMEGDSNTDVDTVRNAGQPRAPRRRGGGPSSQTGSHAKSQDTGNSRRNKNTNKNTYANHNRRDQRARKAARAGFGGQTG